MFTKTDINTLEEILACKLPDEVVKEALNPESVLWQAMDGYRFAFLTIAEQRQMKAFREDAISSPLPFIPELRILWADGESNFMGVFVSGPMLGRLALVGHDTNVDCAPLYRDLGSFVTAMEVGRINADAEWPNLTEWQFQVDYFNGGDEFHVEPSAENARKDLVCAEQVSAMANEASDPIRKRFLQSSVISLTPPQNADRLVPFLDSPDYHVCGRACAVLGAYQVSDVCEKLGRIATDANNPASFRAVDGLGLMKRDKARQTLINIVKSGVELPGNIGTALAMHGENEITCTNESDKCRPVYWWRYGL